MFCKRTKRIAVNVSVCVISLFLSIGLISCSGGANSPNTGDEEEADVVVWEDLKQLNTLLHEAEAYVDGNYMNELKAMIPTLHKTAMAVAEKEPPAKVHHLEEVKLLQHDLMDIAQTLSEFSSMSDEQLKATIETMHPITDKLFVESGAPHTHDFGKSDDSAHHEKDHHEDHDHEEHGHEHDEHE